MVIANGKDRPLSLNPGTLPDVSGALLNLFQRIQFIKVVKNIVNFEVVETYTSNDFQGVVQQFTPRQLMIKKEGQRSWNWVTIHAFPSLVLVPDEVVYIEDMRYRVMSVSDYSKYGYVEYHAIQEYQDRQTAPPIPLIVSLKRYSETVTVGLTLTVTTDISEGEIEDAHAAIWQVYEEDGTKVPATIQIIDDTHVKITVEEAGDYLLAGAE